MSEFAMSNNIPEESSKAKIFLGIPHTGNCCMELVFSIISMLLNKKYQVFFQPLPHRRPVDAARNELVKLFLASNYDYLLMVDADMADDPEFLMQSRFLDLASYDKDIIGAIGLMSKESEIMPVILDWDEKEQGFKAVKTFVFGELLECDAIGTGVIMIKRKVFETLEAPYFKYTYDEDGLLELGQDFYFCQKAQRAGFKIYAHTGMLTSHYQTIDLLPVFKRFAGLTPSAGVNRSNVKKIK